MTLKQKKHGNSKTLIEKIANMIWFKWTSLHYLLLPFSLLFQTIVSARKLAYKLGLFQQEALNVPVIVVGNLIVGGAGKTPTVIALIDLLRRAGFKPGVISRGYRATIKTKRPQEVQADDNATLYGDETVLIAMRTLAPVFFAKNRVLAGKTLLQKYPHINILISDDGLQHYQLKRDFEIIVFDHRMIGNGYMLPAGPLREKVTRHCNAFVMNDLFDTTLHKHQKNIFHLKKNQVYAWQLIDPSKQSSLEKFSQLNVLAVAGISAPEKFFRLLRKFELHPNTIALPDHYSFKNSFFIDKEADIILITEKDAVKCLGQQDPRIWVVRVNFYIDPSLTDLILETLREQKNASNTGLSSL